MALPDTIWVLSETAFVAAAKSFVAVLCLICLTGVFASSIRFENLASTWAQLRHEVPDLFELGDLPLKPSGDGANRVLSFARRHGDRWLIVLAPRLTSRALGRRGDPDTGVKPALRLPAGCPTSWRDVFANKGVRALGKTLSLVSIVKDSVPIVLRNV